MGATISERAASIRLVIFDVDGVLTDGHVHYSDDGSETKSFHVRDGYGMRQLLENGVDIAIISGRKSAAVERRMKELGVSLVHQGCARKIPVFEALLEQVQCKAEHVAFVGDDVPDIEVMRQVGLSIAVADAHAEVAACADWHTTLPGGRGAAREVCDLLLTARRGRDAGRA